VAEALRALRREERRIRTEAALEINAELDRDLVNEGMAIGAPIG
jgi:hypothetical protein